MWMPANGSLITDATVMTTVEQRVNDLLELTHAAFRCGRARRRRNGGTGQDVHQEPQIDYALHRAKAFAAPPGKSCWWLC